METVNVTDIIKKANLKYDSKSDMDRSYGKQFLEEHEQSTFKNVNTIFSDTRIRRLFNTIMSEAIEEGATDIKFVQEEKYCLVKLRIGSSSIPYRLVHKGAGESLTTYVRKLADTNPETTYNPVSAKSRFHLKVPVNVGGENEEEQEEFYDTRIQFHPSNYGTSMVIRIFYNENLKLSVDDLGFEENVAYHYNQALKKQQGLIILSGPTGSGKALDKNTDIPLFRGGFKKLGDLKVGDIIINEKGESTTITAIFDHENNDCYLISFSNMGSVIADSDHNWLVDIENNKDLVLTTKELLPYLIDGKEIKIKLISNPINYDKKPLETNPYKLGIRIGINSRNNENPYIHSDYLFSSITDRHRLLLGILDTISTPNISNIEEVIVTNESFLSQLMQLITSLGYNPSYTFIKGKYKIIFENMDLLLSETNTQYIKINSIIKVDSVPTRCLTVDSPSHLFLCTKDYIVTHNTTTEYVGIKQILNDNLLSKDIVTVEDPIEYKIEGINQSEVDEVRGFTFAEAVKSFLRMNPDVILVGEVRDKATAEAVTRSANSGHLVLTTIHANSTLEVLSVLRQYDIHENDIVNSVQLIISQTLEEKLCEHCRIPTLLKPKQKQWFDRKMLGKPEIAKFYKQNHEGCEHCNYKGVKGRVMLSEMLVTDFEFRVIKESVDGNIDKLRTELLKSENNGYYPMEWDVHRRIIDGDIDYETASKLIH